MSENIKDLHSKYVQGLLSKSELSEYREKIDSLDDDDLWDLMCEESSFPMVSMPESVKEEYLDSFEEEHDRHIFSSGAKLVASLLFLVIAGSLAYYYLYNQPRVENFVNVRVPFGEKSKLILPDGTQIDMNSGTELAYDVVAGDHREVKILKGEAFFDVTKDPDCPFHVMVGNMKIEVLGTTFNVNAKGRKVETALFTGSVKLVSNHSDKVYYLSPGEKSVYEPVKSQFQFARNDRMLDAGWKDGYLSFDSKPLKDVLLQIEDWYGVKIRCLDESMYSDLLTGSFHNESLESVLKTLSIQYHFKYSRNQNDILIKN